MDEIQRQFSANDRGEVIVKLSKTLGYLRRQRAGGERTIEYVLILAKGSKEKVLRYADEAKSDYRNIIFWVENAEQSRLNTPEDIEDFQQTLTWLGMDRDSELEQQRSIRQNTKTKNSNKPWWRFW